MRVTSAEVLLVVASTTTAFTVVPHAKTSTCTRQQSALHAKADDLHLFDAFLKEYDTEEQAAQVVSAVRRQVQDDRASRTTVLASTATFPGATTPLTNLEESVETDADPYASAFDNSQMGKVRNYQEQQQSNTLEAKIKSMDLQDIVVTFFIPAIVVFASARWAFNKVGGRVAENTDEMLDNFANEMIYHDGDFQEMELCVKDYKKKLVFLGPTRNDAMLKRYLQSYAKKKTVSPQAISSLAEVFSMFKLTEDKAAAILVQVCRDMGTGKIASAGKILFFGSRILKSPQGKAALQPIKELIMSTYREGAVAETLVEASQQAIAEASYRTAVLAGGKKQKKLTPGWEVLGLDKDVATRIYEEERKEGFISERESMYGGQTRKYDSKGRQLDAEGKLANPEEADDDDGAIEESASNVYECGNCGFTLFVAEGRESKFFGTGFKCPECGASKKEFIAKDEDDE